MIRGFAFLGEGPGAGSCLSVLGAWDEVSRGGYRLGSRCAVTTITPLGEEPSLPPSQRHFTNTAPTPPAGDVSQRRIMKSKKLNTKGNQTK